MGHAQTLLAPLWFCILLLTVSCFNLVLVLQALHSCFTVHISPGFVLRTPRLNTPLVFALFSIVFDLKLIIFEAMMKLKIFGHVLPKIYENDWHTSKSLENYNWRELGLNSPVYIAISYVYIDDVHYSPSKHLGTNRNSHYSSNTLCKQYANVTTLRNSVVKNTDAKLGAGHGIDFNKR